MKQQKLHEPIFQARSNVAGITIVIPNWNHEFVLPRSIKSALLAVKDLRDRNIPSDVLVIDDGSRDGSLTLLRQLEALYFDQGLLVAAFNENSGIIAARNRALTLAHYDYLVFMDADNELIPENLHLFYRSIVDTEAAVVYGNLLYKEPRSGQSGLISNESFQMRMFEQNYIDTFALYDRLQILDSGGYREVQAMEGHEDWELFLHLAASGRSIVFVPLMFGVYYELPHSRVKPWRQDDQKLKRAEYLQRVYDQFGIRRSQEPRTKHLRYHPDIGYI